MGCIYSKRDLRDLHPNIFQVINVDDAGNSVRAGQIEVTSSDLVLYQKNKDSILWPLRSLRRYGWDAELFSFESGRRAPTGPGIYAFKCHRAQELFNLLQARFAAEESLGNVLRDSTSNHSFAAPRRPTSTIDGYLEPVAPRVAPRIRTTSTSPNGGARVRLDSVDSCSETQSPSPSTSTPPTVIDTATVVRSESGIPGSKQPCDSTTEQPSEVERNNNGHEYSNGVVNYSGIDESDTEPMALEMRNEQIDFKHLYMNVSPGTEPKFLVLNQVVTVPCVLKPTLSNRVIPSLPSPTLAGQPCYANVELTKREVPAPVVDGVVNYAVLDLDQTGEPPNPPFSARSLTPTSGVPPVPPDSPDGQGPVPPLLSGYVTIDFQRTDALSHSVCPNMDYDREASRKTRHNSTINPPD